MDSKVGAENHSNQVGSGSSQKISGNIDDYDYSGRELQIQVLFQADEKNHCHGEHCEEQFVSDSGLAAQNGHGCMEQCKYMYYARGLYLRQVHNSSFKCLCGMPVCPARVTIQS